MIIIFAEFTDQLIKLIVPALPMTGTAQYQKAFFFLLSFKYDLKINFMTSNQ